MDLVSYRLTGKETRLPHSSFSLGLHAKKIPRAKLGTDRCFAEYDNLQDSI